MLSLMAGNTSIGNQSAGHGAFSLTLTLPRQPSQAV